MTVVNLEPNIYIIYKFKRKNFAVDLVFHGLVSDKLEVADLVEKGWTAMRVGKDWTRGASGGSIKLFDEGNKYYEENSKGS